MFKYIFLTTILSLIGIFISYNIYKERKSKHLKKEASYFLDTPVDVLGMSYYSLIFLYSIISLIFPIIEIMIIVPLFFTSLAFLFSIYLSLVLLFSYRKGCFECILSAIISLGILFLILLLAKVDLLNILYSNKQILIIIHLIGVVLGVGGATITDRFFFNFLKDFRISHYESKILEKTSEIIWVGLGLTISSGIGLYLLNASALNAAPKFLIKVIVVLVILLNGIILNMYVSPRMIHINFDKRFKHLHKKLHIFRRIAFACGAISITSWYSALILGSLPIVFPLSFLTLLLVYLGILGFGIILSQMLEKYYDIISRKK